MAAPLEGIRIIDFTRDWTGPLCTRMLGDLGAEVIKVEYTKRLCSFRGGYIENQKYNHHPRWHQVNRNKRSVTLDLHVEAERRMFLDLVKVSDVLVNSCRPGVFKKFGLAYDTLKALKPDLIFVSLTAFGSSGPYSAFGGYGATLEAMSGVNQLTGYERSGPRYRIKEMDVTNGIMAAGAVMTALVHRQQTGEGQWVDLSLLETATHMIAGEHFLAFDVNGEQALPLGNRHDWFAPQGCYRCKGDDQWLTLTIRTEDQWKRLCELLEHPEWTSDARFADRRSRAAHLETIDSAIENWTGRRSHIEAMEILQERSIPAGAVLNVAELCQDRHLTDRKYFLPSAEDPERRYPGMVTRLKDLPKEILRRGPDLGQDNEYVICTLLGRPASAIPPVVEAEIGTSYDPE